MTGGTGYALAAMACYGVGDSDHAKGHGHGRCRRGAGRVGHELTGEPHHGSVASMRTKAIRQGLVPRLTQAWFVPCWISTSPASRWISESSSSMSISPSMMIT